MFQWWLWSPLSPPPPQYFPAWAPCLQPLFPCVHISLLLLRPLCLFFVYLSSPPVAPVVTRRPPVTDWRPVPWCPWCSFQCPDVWGFFPPTCAAGGTWVRCGWRGVGDGAPRCYWCLQWRISWCLSLCAPPLSSSCVLSVCFSFICHLPQ